MKETLFPFEPDPRFINHMCHWRPWANHFESDADHDKKTLALMLGYAEDEIKRLCKTGVKESIWSGALLYAYVMICERLCFWCRRKVVPVTSGWPTITGALKYIEILNRWRAEKKFGDLEP